METILVIEDTESVRQEIADTLQLENYSVIEAKNGRVGLQLASQCHPDLILCDVMMPEVGGYEVLATLRSDSQTSLTPFIFLTARTERDDVRLGMALGADDYLTKPFTLSDLLSAVRSRLRRHNDLTIGRGTGPLREAQRQLTRMVAHELRTPLISIRMVQDLLRRGASQMTPAQFNELLDTLDLGTRRMSHLVEQMIYTTQIESGMLVREAIEHNGTVLSVWDLLTTTIPLARQFATRQRNVDIQVDARDQDSTFRCDIPSLKHALAELVANAINFSPEGGQVTVSQWKADDQIWVSILDQGPGIPHEHVDEVWRDFHQVNRDSQEQQGLGLGLTLSRRIVEMHGGTLTLDSAEGKGTQVTVSLPAAPEGSP
jgi:signal transduction histidine kinase